MSLQLRAAATAAAIVLATAVSGCGDGSEPSPVTPTPSQTPPAAPAARPAATVYTLAGVVFEVTSAGNSPVDGVEVFCDPCGPPAGHTSLRTDHHGVYSFDGSRGVPEGAIELLVAKPGYLLPDRPDMSGPGGNGWMGSVSVTVTGDTRFDIQIIRKQPASDS